VTVSTGLDSLQTPLVVECASWVKGCRITVERMAGSSWQAVGDIHPRGLNSAVAIDSVPAGPLRLRFTGYAQVRSIARLAEQPTGVSTSWGDLQAGTSSVAGEVRAVIAEEDTLFAALTGPDTLRVDFSGSALGQGVVRSNFLGIVATPVSSATCGAFALSRGQQALPTRFVLYQNAPNPFRNSTAIRFDLPSGQAVRLEIFDAQGRRVRTLLNRFVPAGRQVVQWDHRAEGGATVAAGVYFYRLQTDVFRNRKKMILLP
jgi:flagellar hook capping protein FlgD